MSSLPQYSSLLPPSWRTQVNEWLAEDTPSFDYGGFVVGEAEREAYLLGKGKQRAVLAGVPFFNEVFEQLGCRCAISFTKSRSRRSTHHIPTALNGICRRERPLSQ